MTKIVEANFKDLVNEIALFVKLKTSLTTCKAIAKYSRVDQHVYNAIITPLHPSFLVRNVFIFGMTIPFALTSTTQ